MDFLSPTIWTGFGGALVYYLIMAITPGPNNIILANSGLNFGYMKTVKLLLGIMLGVNVFLLIAILGFSHLFQRYKLLHIVISVLGVGFLVYLGCKMAMSNSTLQDNQSSKQEKSKQRKPLSIFTITLLQFSNVKSMMVSISITSIYHKPTIFGTYIFLCAVVCISIVSVGNIWILCGSVLSKFLTNPRNAKIFNIIMGLTLVIYSLFLLPIADIKALLS